MRTCQRPLGILFVAAIAGCGDVPSDVEENSSELIVLAPMAIDYGGSCSFRESHQCTVAAATPGGQPATMHCCPKGRAMQGYYDATDSYWCVSVPYVQGPATTPNHREECRWRSVQTPVVEGQRMLGCQGNEYMAGFQKSSNKIACCPTRYPNGAVDPVSLSVDGNNEPATQTAPGGYAMDGPGIVALDCGYTTTAHRCGERKLMFGLNTNRNYLMCGF